MWNCCRGKIFQLVLIFCISFFLFSGEVKAASQCHGDGGITLVEPFCDTNFLGNDFCNSSSNSSTSSCGFSGNTCQRLGSSNSGTCQMNMGNCIFGPAQYSYTTNGCWTCDDEVWGACSASCGGGTQTNQCGGSRGCNNQPCCTTVYGTWNATCNLGCSRTCNGGSCPVGDCSNVTMPSCAVDGTYGSWSPSDCTPACNQTVTRSCSATCGGVCPSPDGFGASKVCANTDDGIPSGVNLVYPLQTAANPVVISSPQVELRWTPVYGLNDGYVVTVEQNSPVTYVWGTTISGAAVDRVTTNATFTPGVVYRWTVQSQNNSCGTDRANPTAYGYFRINRAPTIVGIRLFTDNATEVFADGSSRNHICELPFQNTVSSQTRVRFDITFRDLDGAADILNGQVQLSTYANALSFTPVNATDAVGRATIDFAGINDPNTYNIMAYANDTWSSNAFTNTGRLFKVWNCDVDTSGTVYDGSPLISCPTIGFTNEAPVSMNFTALSFGAVNMPITPPATFGPGILRWGQTYGITYPGIEATGMNYRINGGNCNNLASVVLDQARVDAYAIDPVADIDFSFIRNQDGWYQVKGSGIEARNSINSAVPVTCSLPGCTPALVVNNVGVSDDGMVAAVNYNITSGCTDCDRGYPRDIYVDRNIMYDKLSYESIKNSYWGRLGLGTTMTGDHTLTEVIAQAGTDGVAFVNGNLNINQNNSVAVGSFLMVVVSGTITIDPSVTTVAGVFVSNTGIVATGANATALNISGVLYSLQNIAFTRTFASSLNNNTAPAVVVNFRPDFIFNMPVALTRAISLRY